MSNPFSLEELATEWQRYFFELYGREGHYKIAGNWIYLNDRDPIRSGELGKRIDTLRARLEERIIEKVTVSMGFEPSKIGNLVQLPQDEYGNVMYQPHPYVIAGVISGDWLHIILPTSMREKWLRVKKMSWLAVGHPAGLISYKTWLKLIGQHAEIIREDQRELMVQR